MEIKILGPGCATCHKLAQMAALAVEELGIDAPVVAVTDMQEIRKITDITPALLVNGILKYAGKPLPTLERLKELIRAEQKQ